MNFLNNLRVISIPHWSRWLIFLQLLGALAISVFMITYSLGDPKKADWIQAGAYVLGIVLPIFIFALIIWTSETGPTALQTKTTEFLTNMVPEFLERIEETENKFLKCNSRKIPHKLSKSKSTVYCNAVETRCYCDYIIKNDIFSMMIRLEINVKKANFNLYIDKDKLISAKRIQDSNEAYSVSQELFKHTLAGAQAKLGSSKMTKEDASIPENYEFNDALIERIISGREYYVLVGSRTLTDDFLWNPAEKLFFTQDLMFMLRAFLTEQPNLFLENDHIRGEN